VRTVVWSPVVAEVAVEAEAPGTGARQLWIARADGTSAERIASYRSTTHGALDWSRDGQTIVYAGLAGERLQLFAVARRGGEPRQVTRDEGNLLHPAVSPDDRWIAATRFSCHQVDPARRRRVRGRRSQAVFVSVSRL